MGPEMTIIAPRPLRKPGDKSQVIRHSDTGTVTETVCRDSAMLPTGRLAGAVWPAVQAAFRPGPSANHARRNAQHADLASSWNLTGNRQAWSSGHGPSGCCHGSMAFQTGPSEKCQCLCWLTGLSESDCLALRAR